MPSTWSQSKVYSRGSKIHVNILHTKRNSNAPVQLTCRHETPERLAHGTRRWVHRAKASLACGWCEPLQAGRVPLTAKTFFIALTTTRLGLIALDLAGPASPASCKGFRAFLRSNWGGHGIETSTHPHMRQSAAG